MANSILKLYRADNPDDDRSDEELTLLIGKELTPQALSSYPDFASEYNAIEMGLRKANAPSLPAEFTRTFGSGVDIVQAKLYDTAALAGDIVGSETLQDFGTAGYKRNLDEAEVNAPTIRNFTDVEGPSDLLRYGVGLAGSQAPQILGTIGGGVAGLLATGGNPLGGIAGAGAMGFSQMQNRGELRDMPGVDQDSVIPTALGVGAIGAVLESFVPLKVISKYFRGVSDDVARGYFAQVLRDVPANAINEATTEGLQEITAMAGELYANRDNPQFQLTREQVYNRLINATAGGGILGGATGLSGGRRRTLQNESETQDGTTETLDQGQTIPDPRVQENLQTAVSGQPAPPVDDVLTQARNQAANVGDPDWDDYTDAITYQAQQQPRLPAEQPPSSSSELVPPAEVVPVPTVEQPPSPPVVAEIATTPKLEIPNEGEALELEETKWVVDAFKSDDVQSAFSWNMAREVQDKNITLKERFEIEDALKRGEVPKWPTKKLGDMDKWFKWSIEERARDTEKEISRFFSKSGNDLPINHFKEQREKFRHSFEQPNLEYLKFLESGWREMKASGFNLYAHLASDKVSGARSSTNQKANPAEEPASSVLALPSTIPLAAEVQAAAAETNIAPTDAQKEAGNYKKGVVEIQGLPVAIENPAGTERSGTDADGKPWKVTLSANYGYIKGTEGKDGDAVDVYVGPQPELPNVYVVDQVNSESGKFDETKTMIGFPSRETAIAAYDAGFSDGKGPLRRANVTPASIDEFKNWLEEGDSTKPFAATVKDSLQVQTPPVVAAAPIFDVEQIDFEGVGLVKGASNRGRGGKEKGEAVEGEEQQEFEDIVMEPAFFQITSNPIYSPELADRLTSYGKGDQGKKSDTRRITFFEDIDTGQVLGLPTWYTDEKSRGGKIVRVAPLPGEKKGTTLQKLMASGRYVPVASMRMKPVMSATDQANVAVFEDARVFEDSVILPAREKARNLASFAAPMAAKMQKQGFTEGGNVIELAGEQQNVEEDSRQVVADALIELLPRETLAGQTTFRRDLTVDHVKEALVQASGMPEFMEGTIGLIRETFGQITRNPQEYPKFKVLSVPQQQQYILDKISNEAYGRIKELGAGANPARLSEGNGGNDRYSRPRGSRGRASSAEIAGRFNQLVQRLGDIGFRVDVLNAIEREMGKFSKKKKLITLSLFDAENPSPDNLRLVLHEAAHELFAGLPKEFREALTASINEFSDDKLGLNASTDPRIRQNNPAGLAPHILAEERIAEALALRGMQKEVARGLVADLMRYVKDLYFRLAIAAQKIMGRKLNGELALRYAENRMQAMEAGTNLRPLFNELIPPQVIFNDESSEDRFSHPERIGDRLEPSVIIETDAAAFNEWIAFTGSLKPMLQAVPEFNNMAIAEGKDVVDLWREVNGFHDAVAMKTAKLAELDPTTSNPINSNPNVRIADFKAEQNKAVAANRVYRFIQAQYAKLHRSVLERRDQLDALTARHKEVAESVKEIATDYANVDGLTRKMTRDFKRMFNGLFRDVASAGANMGAITQQLVALGETRDTIQYFAPVFRKLFTGTELKGEKLFDFLDDMANDSRIDLTKDIRVIRSDLTATGDAKFTPLIQNTVEGKALLAATVAYAKRNNLLMLALELRKMQDLGRRQKINEMLKGLLQDGKDLGEALTDLPRVATMEDRLRVALRTEKRKAKGLSLEVKRRQAIYDASFPLVDVYRQKMRELQGVNQIHAPSTYGHRMEYWVPKTNSATGLGNGFELKRIALDTSTGKPTNKVELEDHIARMTDWLDKATVKDGVYYQVLHQRDEIVLNGIVGEDVRHVDFTIMGLRLSDLATQFKSFGTPAARLAGQMLNKFTSIVKFLSPEGLRLGLAVEKARRNASNLIGSERYYMTNYYDATVAFFEKQRDIVEKFPNSLAKQFDEGFLRLRAHMLKNPATRTELAGKVDTVFAALRRHVEAEWKASQWYDEKLTTWGVGVRDDSLRVEGEKKGEFVAGERKRQQRGITTMPRRRSATFDTVFDALDKAGWAGANDKFGNIGKMYNDMGADEARAQVQPLFANGEVQKDFFQALVQDIGVFSPFNAPIFADGVTQPEANPGHVNQAFLASKGDAIAFAEAMYDLHGGTTDKGKYVQEVLGVFGTYFGEMRSVMEKHAPDGMDVPKDWKNMVPGFMVNSRKIEHWPASWTTYTSFDRQTNHGLNQRVAAEVAFGIEQDRLASSFKTLVGEVQAGIKKLKQAEAKVERTNPSNNRKVIEAALEAEVGGKSELKRLIKLREQEPLLRKVKGDLIDYFHGKDSPIKPLRFMQQMIGLFASMMLNQPGSALSQLSEVFSPMLSFNVSPHTIRYTMRTIGSTIEEIAGGLAEAVGIQWSREDRMRDRFLELNQGDPAAMATWKDAFIGEISPYDQGSWLDKGTRFMQTAQRVQASGTSRAGEKARYTTFRLFAPFLQSSIALHAASTMNLWRMVDDFVSQGVKVQIAKGLIALRADATLEQWATELGCKGRSKDTFVRLFTVARDDWGLDFFRLVAEGQKHQASGKDTLSDLTLQRLIGMGVKEMSTESNIVTMPIAAFNNSPVKMMLPLLGWSVRRGGKVLDIRYDEKGKASWVAFAKGLAALAVVGGGGLAVSALVDAYNEELLNKRRNLRRLTLDQGADNLALAILEHTTRVGTLGLFGEVLNTAVNVSTGEGDNRGVSLDSRVVFVNSTIGLLKGVSAFINQGFEADYANVIRPTMYAVGMNGALQYMQMANNLFDADNAESRATARTNAGNWLRVAGRELEMEVRVQTGGYSTPTPITPFVTRMQLAALGNDPTDFHKAHREALTHAREEGKADPADYVQNSFRSRHPLRSIFRTVPSETDYRKILLHLPEDVRRDVMEAVNSFNHYGAMIGVTPFDGKEEKTTTTAKQKPRTAFDRDLARNRAALFGTE